MIPSIQPTGTFGYAVKTRFFEWYVKTLWNIHRLFVKTWISERCRICSISEVHSPLINGICRECWLRSSTGKEETIAISEDSFVVQLTEVLKAHVNKGSGNYDGLVLLSGGKDSAILLHKLKQDFPKLRILALTADTGFLSPVALENIRYLVRFLDIDHILYRPPTKLYIKGFRFALTHLGDQGCYGNVDRLDGDLVHDIARNFAASHKIPLLISGVSRQQVEKIFGIKSFEMPREKELEARKETGGIPLMDIYSLEEQKYWWDPSRYDSRNVPRVLFPLYAWNFDEQEIRKKVINLKLIRQGKDSPLVTNNLLLPLMSFVDIAKLGFSSFEHEFAGMIRDGKTDRRLWRNIFEMIEYSAKTDWLLGNEVDATLKQLGLQRSDVGLDKKMRK